MKKRDIVLSCFIIFCCSLIGCINAMTGGNPLGSNKQSDIGRDKYDLKALLSPINEKINKVNETIEQLETEEGWAEFQEEFPYTDEFKGKKPNFKGRAGVMFFCYSEHGIVDKKSCKRGEELGSGKGTMKMISIAPLIEETGKPFVVREAMSEIITIDPNQKDLIKQFYFFGDPKFDLIYLTKLGLAIKQAQNDMSNPLKAAKLAGTVPEALCFVKNFTSLLADLGEGATTILSQTTKALKNPDPQIVEQQG